MDAIQLLMQDHRKVEQLFAQVQKSSDPLQIKQLALKIETELTVHAEVEEKIFYPAVRLQAPDLIKEAYHEHGEAKLLLNEIAGADPTTPEGQQYMKKLMQAIQHHVQEEEGQLFKKVQKAMDNQTLLQLGHQMQDAKLQGLQAAESLAKQKMEIEMGQIGMISSQQAGMPAQM